MSRTKPQLPMAAKVLIGVVLATFAVNIGATLLTLTGMLGGRESPVSEWKGRVAPELVVSTTEGHTVRLRPGGWWSSLRAPSSNRLGSKA